MSACIFVGLGGACGAVCRYLLGSIPLRIDFPVLTLLTNFLGAVVIGCVVGLVMKNPGASPNLVLFLKTGFCGGFTTFSTFSLETLNLLENRQVVKGGLYAVVSVLLCIAGVYLGRALFTALATWD